VYDIISEHILGRHYFSADEEQPQNELAVAEDDLNLVDATSVEETSVGPLVNGQFLLNYSLQI
jgi:hypothetical protein